MKTPQILAELLEKKFKVTTRIRRSRIDEVILLIIDSYDVYNSVEFESFLTEQYSAEEIQSDLRIICDSSEFIKVPTFDRIEILAQNIAFRVSLEKHLPVFLTGDFVFSTADDITVTEKSLQISTSDFSGGILSISSSKVEMVDEAYSLVA